MKLEQLKLQGWRDQDFIQLLEELLGKMKNGSLRVMENVRCNEQWDNSNMLEARVIKLLNKLGIPFHLKGRVYIQAAIIYYVQKGSTDIVITKELYPRIAKSYNTTAARVERAMRHACERCFDEFNEERDYIFGNTVNIVKGKPSNKEFITALVDYILHGYDLY